MPTSPKPVKKSATAKPAVSKVATTEKTADDKGPKIRIKIRAFDHKIIDTATKTIIETAERNSATVVGPVPLPTEIKKISVNRSTFVHRKAAEQYEIRTHKRLIDIFDLNPKAIDALMNLRLPAGVDVEIKMS